MTHTLTWLHEVTDDGVQSPAELRSVMMRVFCHALIDLMPQSGLEDMTESLKEAFEYYRPSPPHAALQPAPARFLATLAGVYERPDFHVVEE